MYVQGVSEKNGFHSQLQPTPRLVVLPSCQNSLLFSLLLLASLYQALCVSSQPSPYRNNQLIDLKYYT